MKPTIPNLKKAQKRFDVKLKSTDVEKACKELQSFFKDEYDKEELDDCYGCGYLVPDEDMDGNLVEVCPYCGSEFEYDEDEDDFEREEVEEEVEETPVLEGLSPDSLSVEDENDEEESDDSAMEVEAEIEEDETEDASDEVEEEEVEEDVEVESVEPDMVISQDEVDKIVHKLEEKQMKIAKKRGTPDILALTPAQEEELQISIDRINSIKNRFVDNVYDLGVELTNISENMLWKAKSKSFKDFCETVLDISRSSAYKFMNCSSKFSKEDFMKLGIKKADILTRLPDGKRENVAKKVIEDNMTTHDVVDYIKESTQLPKHTDKEREIKKEEVKRVKEDTSTILAKVKEDNEIEVPWVDFGSDECLEERSEDEKYAIIKISDEVELVVLENEFGTGLVCSFRNHS